MPRRTIGISLGMRPLMRTPVISGTLEPRAISDMSRESLSGNGGTRVLNRIGNQAAGSTGRIEPGGLVTRVEPQSRIAVYEEVKVWSKKWSWRSLRYVRFCSQRQRMRYRKYASNAPEIELQSSALHPHARAAGTPTGGSIFLMVQFVLGGHRVI